ncbi:DNA polymerase (pol2) [Edhazardia aedis USNM 41457]|uniref:DNA polymerase n=1 Tax=Edhazardia aedis (strain USNM 41457) TaxID=1003232 RepID=J9D0N1_EDHAE|nr:DNA polymerase (pol2) [Edhazardia aedis USNM 41457]|eukprot:EJW01441.1 DNA polymerase (pol2) [Edhazardia aedis USNM 41457]
MYFYLLHVEEETNSSINLFGYKLRTSMPTTKNVEALPCKINVSNIFSPYLLYSSDKDYLKGLMKCLSEKEIVYSVNKKTKKNFFYKGYPQDLPLICLEISGKDNKALKASEINNIQYLDKLLVPNRNKNKSQNDESENTQNLRGLATELKIKEFSSPIEQFIISNRIKGPSILHITNFDETTTGKYFVKDLQDIKFIKNDELPFIKIAYLVVNINNFDVSSFSIQIHDTKTNTEKLISGVVKTSYDKLNSCLQDECFVLYRNSNELISHLNSIINLEKPSFLIYHNIPAKNLKMLNLAGIITCDLYMNVQEIIRGRTFSLQEICETINCEIKIDKSMIKETIEKIFYSGKKSNHDKLKNFGYINDDKALKHSRNNFIDSKISDNQRSDPGLQNHNENQEDKHDNNKQIFKNIDFGGKEIEKTKTDFYTTNLIQAYKKEMEPLIMLFHNIRLLRLAFEKLNILELSKQLTEISGNLLIKTMHNARAERNEYLLLHECYEKNYLFPPNIKDFKERTYSGGLVLQPVVGFHENLILLLDFSSLYPSIIQEHNICFSTIGLFDDESSCNFKEKNQEELKIFFTDLENKYKNQMNSEKTTTSENNNLSARNLSKLEIVDMMGFLPRILYNLVSRRRAVKDLMKSTADKQQLMLLETRQKALKLTANSIYGCLGANFSRFCNFTMASYITYKGRELLKETKEIAENLLKMKVIYGDTDSIMIDTMLPGLNSNYKEAIKMSVDLKNKINSRFNLSKLK